MDKILNENLFLLEFLVDEVNLHPGVIPCELEYAAGETCMSIQFLDNDPLDICEAEFNQDCCTPDQTMKNGKSCLFAISPKQIDDVMKRFDLDVSIYKKLMYGVEPNKVKLGTSKISLEALFNEILQALKDDPESGTVSKTLKDIYPIIPLQLGDKCCIGDIVVFVRMSCFGKLIVTQFQMNLQEKSVFFKDKEGKSVYKYRKACSPEMQGQECIGTCPGADLCADQTFVSPCGPQPCYMPCFPPQVPCGPPPTIGYCGPPNPCSFPPCSMTNLGVPEPCGPCGPCGPMPPCPTFPPPSCCQDICAEMSGR